MSGALGAWEEALQGWGIPEEILARAPVSPWSYPTESFRRRAEHALRAGSESTPTIRRALEALPEDGVVLDVGVGSGAASLPLAVRASRIVGVDTSQDMLTGFREEAERAGVAVHAVAGRWPEVADQVGTADVAVCAHVLYNVQQLEPFVDALQEHADRVVIELTESHPLAWMGPLWQRFHRLDRPQGPRATDAIGALGELGIHPRVERDVRRSRGGFRRREDAIAVVRRRLCLAEDRDPEIAEALGPQLSEEGGTWSAGPPQQVVVTLWWDLPRGG